MCTGKIREREESRATILSEESERERERRRKRERADEYQHDSMDGTFFIIVESIAPPARA